MSIGVCLAQLSELVHTVRRYGLSERQLDRIEQAIEEFATAADARRPSAPKNALNAALAQMLVLEEELRPRRLSAYGPIDADAELFLNARVQQLVDLTNELISETTKVRP